ncbi:MAG: hypothetical protein ATN35_05250 [Epulopiscium sp. Nele67-Bin004]|nr:MAG: hypothetical protein ATN35_05250 [Epulopiscium sp. Nele67-Bin004]
MQINNETIGISAEIVIADIFNISVNDSYRHRGNKVIETSLVSIIKQVFTNEPTLVPIAHIAEDQSPVDFMLSNGKTLSLKTNQQFSKKVAPQNVGQPTSSTYYDHFSNIYTNYVIPRDYEGRCKLFKEVSIDRINEVMAIYWKNLFHCDYLLHIYNIINANGQVTNNAYYTLYPMLTSHNFIKANFSFTQTATSWNESNTVKYCGITIGEFQVHNNRDCFKFRFNMEGINKLLIEKLI